MLQLYFPVNFSQMEETLDQYKKELEQKDREILRLARYALFFCGTIIWMLYQHFWSEDYALGLSE